jgi:hypothetical protein
MATININTQILDGNLGEGWADNYEAAQGLAEYTEKTWRAELNDLSNAGHEICISIDVQRNVSGCSREMCVTVSGMDFDAAYDLEKQVSDTLTDENRIWEKFCASEEAGVYLQDDAE